MQALHQRTVIQQTREDQVLHTLLLADGKTIAVHSDYKVRRYATFHSSNGDRALTQLY